MNNVPRICTVISCGQTKQDLETGQTVPARELYTSPVHTCKDRYGRHSHGYFIASAIEKDRGALGSRMDQPDDHRKDRSVDPVSDATIPVRQASLREA